MRTINPPQGSHLIAPERFRTWSLAITSFIDISSRDCISNIGDRILQSRLEINWSVITFNRLYIFSIPYIFYVNFAIAFLDCVCDQGRLSDKSSKLLGLSNPWARVTNFFFFWWLYIYIYFFTRTLREGCSRGTTACAKTFVTRFNSSGKHVFFFFFWGYIDITLILYIFYLYVFFNFHDLIFEDI